MDQDDWAQVPVKKGIQKFSMGKAIAAQKKLNINGLAEFLRSNTAIGIFAQGYKFIGVKLNSCVGPMKKYKEVDPLTVLLIAIENQYGDYAVFYKPDKPNSK